MTVWPARRACGARSRRFAAGLGEPLRTPPGGATVGRSSAHVSSSPADTATESTTRYPEAGYMSRHFRRACAPRSWLQLRGVAGHDHHRGHRVRGHGAGVRAGAAEELRRHAAAAGHQRRAGEAREDPPAGLRLDQGRFGGPGATPNLYSAAFADGQFGPDGVAEHRHRHASDQPVVQRRGLPGRRHRHHVAVQGRPDHGDVGRASESGQAGDDLDDRVPPVLRTAHHRLLDRPRDGRHRAPRRREPHGRPALGAR